MFNSAYNYVRVVGQMIAKLFLFFVSQLITIIKPGSAIQDYHQPPVRKFSMLTVTSQLIVAPCSVLL
jgi:tetrahydromethanopterin S-methyltransferase subunit D